MTSPERFFSPREVADLRGLPADEQPVVFFDYWTLKESYIKARGLGLALPLRHFSFLRTPGEAPTIAFEPELHDDPASWQFAQFWPTAEHRMAVAVRRTGADLPIDRRAGRARGSGVKLWAISDLHVGYEENRRAVEGLPARPEDWLIIAGDTGESPAHLDFVLSTLSRASRRSSGRPAITTSGRRAACRRGRAARRTINGWCGCAKIRRADAGRSLRGLARRRAAHGHRADVPALRLLVPTGRRARRTRRSRGRRRAACAARTKNCSARIRIASRPDWCAARVAETEATAGRAPG